MKNKEKKLEKKKKIILFIFFNLKKKINIKYSRFLLKMHKYQSIEVPSLLLLLFLTQ